MTDKAEAPKVHEPPIPLFLKISYVGFCLFGIWYLFTYWKGEVSHATRGPLVLEINRVMQTPGAAWLGFIALCLVAFVAGLLLFAFRSGTKEE